MATPKSRIHIALDKNTLSLLNEMSQRTQKSVSSICAELIRQQIEDACAIQHIKSLGSIDIDSAILASNVRGMLDPD